MKSVWTAPGNFLENQRTAREYRGGAADFAAIDAEIAAIDGSRNYDLFFATHRMSRVGRKEAPAGIEERT